MKVKFTKMQVSHNGSALPYPLLFSVVGLVQGACLWWLLRTADTGSWLSGQPVAQTGLIFLAIAFPFAVYWTQQIEGLSLRARGIAVIVYALLFGFFGTYLRWASVLPSEKLVNQNLGLRPTELIAVSVLGFVSLSLFCGFDFAIKRWNYSKLFEYTWRNGILTFTAMVMTSSMWVVLFAGSMLMGLIKVTWVAELLKEPAFGYPMTGLVFAASVALGLHRASMIEAIRRFWLSISSWLLLLVLFFAVCWSIALPFSGLQSLFSTKNAALIMFWFAALAVKFTNCAYQDGQAAWPYPRRVAWATQMAWLCLIPVTAVGIWALGLRVQQHGWSETRLWAGLVALLALIYVFGYVLSWFDRSRWMANVAKTNIFAACALCLVLIGFLSPVANVQKLGVDAHLSRVIAKDAGSEPDWSYLRWKSGRFGQQALVRFASGEGGPYASSWSNQAKLALKQRSHYDTNARVVEDENLLTKEEQKRTSAQIVSYPAGKKLPETFLTYLRSDNTHQFLKNCVQISDVSNQCSAWIGDLNGDKQDEVVIFIFKPPYKNGTAFTFEKNSWQEFGQMSERSKSFVGSLTELESARPVRPSWSSLEISGKQYQIIETDRSK